MPNGEKRYVTVRVLGVVLGVPMLMVLSLLVLGVYKHYFAPDYVIGLLDIVLLALLILIVTAY